MLRGALAAAVTPLDGDALDEGAFGPYVDFLAGSGLDGLLALGTTGEGVLFRPDERRRALELFVAASAGRLQVAAHCGAQTTADTVALAEHAAAVGADAVAAIGPPYYALDDDALLAHFVAAGRACAPLPFYLYEFRARAGYSLSPELVRRVRVELDNLAGLKVSNKPFDAVAPYLDLGLDVFVGAEGVVREGLEAGAAGAVSGLGSAFPEEVARHVRDRTGDPGALRAALERFPFHAALKTIVARRGVPLRPDVRAPLRGLRPDEREELERWLASS